MKHTLIMSLLVLSLTSASWSANTSSDEALRPYMAATLGIMPLASGLYVTQNPQLGIIFTAFDIAMIGGAFSSQRSNMQKKSNAKYYWYALGIGNILDMIISYNQLEKEINPQPKVSLTAHGAVNMTFEWHY